MCLVPASWPGFLDVGGVWGEAGLHGGEARVLAVAGDGRGSLVSQLLGAVAPILSYYSCSSYFRTVGVGTVRPLLAQESSARRGHRLGPGERARVTGAD